MYKLCPANKWFPFFGGWSDWYTACFLSVFGENKYVRHVGGAICHSAIVCGDARLLLNAAFVLTFPPAPTGASDLLNRQNLKHSMIS